MPTPGRKQLPATEQVESGFDEDKTWRMSAAANALALASTEIAQRFGDGLPYDRARVVHEARFFMAHSAEAMLEAGKRLIQIKENEPHGDFTEIVVEQLGLGERSAQLMMQAAVKFLSPALSAQAKSIALLGKTKLYNLMLERDEDLVELAEGGTVAGLDLDDMRCMSASELRKALAEARQSMAAKDRVIQTKSCKLDKLAEDAEARNAAPLPEKEALQIADLHGAALRCEGPIQALLNAVSEVMDNAASDAAALCARQTLEYIVQRLMDGCAARAIRVDLSEIVAPAWAAEFERMIEGHRAAAAAAPPTPAKPNGRTRR